MLGLAKKEMLQLMEVALGKEKADVVLDGGSLVNVYTGELLENQCIAIKGKWIAYVGPRREYFIGSNTELLDIRGMVMIPGFIDGHAHLMYYSSPDEFLRYVIKGGTTTVVTELMDVTFSFGYSGLINLLDGFKGQPIKVFATTPSSITLSSGFQRRAPRLEELRVMLNREDIVGIGEGYWQNVINGDEYFPELASEALKLRKSIEGHAAGCRGEKLRAYLDFGVSSCHESVNVNEVIEKIRLGICTMIREGSVRKELEAMVALKDMPLQLRRLALVTDGVDPRDLIKNGYMDYLVQKAINLGFDPILALQMATLHPAEHFHLDHILGGIAPGKYADIVVLPNLYTIKPEWVISNGKIVFKDNEVKVFTRKLSLNVGGLKDIHVEASNFKIPVKTEEIQKVRVIHQVTNILTREIIVDMIPQEGELRCNLENDILKVALITWERKIFTGFIKGIGLKEGTLATSYLWEGFGIIVIGANDEEMTFAVNQLGEAGGGIILCSKGKILNKISLPIGGMLSDIPVEQLVRELQNIQRNAEELGVCFNDILLTLSTLTSPAIPFVRLSEDGLVDIRRMSVTGLLVK